MLGADSGGSGLRIALARTSQPGAAPETVGTVTSSEPVRTGSEGIDAGHMLAQLVPAVRGLLAEAGGEGEGLDAVCVGAAGMATLGGDLRATLPGALNREFGTRHVALAADAVAGYAGALGDLPGAVVAGGTGLIAVGTDLDGWRRADGWGHLLGDCGGGAWIGQAGLQAAMRAFDGREGGSQPLRERAEARFGAPLSGLPPQLYPRTDRPAVLASFAPDVTACAADGDPVAAAVMSAAALEIAAAAAAVCPSGEGAVIALTGGLFKAGAPLLEPLRAELARHVPHARAVTPAGGPLDGALLVAARLTEGTLRLPRDPALLSVS
ncbi:ATPase [Streptomyces abyssalis]|uniref:ATPase n=1 Tax=Streptomyces abyssalis TaxID=933944 RepID=A0A1E7JT96_9ACTN|nr:BadF/BadG/BcrA/BcrD ATPase family protein [Streptomyces abyssalis]OEU92097.1 ATPase [Streptomyces abyssalis]OEU94624.1 ATPase [Streptomyces abyssalis]